MLDNEPTGAAPEGADTDPTTTSTASRPRRRRAASRPAGPPQPVSDEPTPPPARDVAMATAGHAESSEPAETAAERPGRRRTAKKAAAPSSSSSPDSSDLGATEASFDAPTDHAEVPRKAAKRSRKKATSPASAPADGDGGADGEGRSDTDAAAPATSATSTTPAFQPPGVLFQAPDPVAASPRASARRAAADDAAERDTTDGSDVGEDEDDELGEDSGTRRRRRGGRGRRSRGRSGSTGGDGTEETSGSPGEADGDTSTSDADDAADGDEGESDDGTGTRRRRRRRRRGTGEDGVELAPDDPPNTVVRVREPRSRARGGNNDDPDVVRSLKGSTRLEAKKQRRREGRDAGRKRPAIITEAEFLARRESVDRVMVVRQTGERTQIAVLEDNVLVEHYVASASSAGTLGNVYLGKVQNVLPSMEAAFVDIGKGRNAVLYAGEVNWDAAGLDGQPKRIEQALKSGDSVLVQVTKDPIGHKGARLTSQVSLAGRYLVYVPHGSMTGISRKLPENERTRLKSILKKVVPEEAGVIVRTAAEGATEDELSRDVARLTAQWEDIEKKAKTATAPALLYGEPEMTIRVVRDIFNEDFAKLIVSGDDAWDMLDAYVGHVAPDLKDRLSRWTSEQDVFAEHRIDEQLAKALDRKVWLPSGGYLIIDRTEAMIVIDVNTGKFTGAGGNLEETVTKNNVEAAEEIVRQLRLRDLGGMIVIDFIDMVLESNRDLVLRRMLECLGRDRTKHQVAEVTSLGLVQMTRKRVGQGLFEAFSETCDCCNGRGVHIRTEPVDANGGGSSGGSGGSGGSGAEQKSGGGRGRSGGRKPSPPSAGPHPGPAAPAPAESPVAVEDPVEPAGTAAESTDEPAAAPARRRRRKAEAPATSL